MPDAASSAVPVGVPLSAGVAGSVVEWLGVAPPVLALALAAAGLGMAHARTMPRWQAGCVWICSALCSAWLGDGLAHMLGTAAGRVAPQSLVGVCVVGAGIAMHPLIRWIGRRFPDVADSAARRVGVDIKEGQQ